MAPVDLINHYTMDTLGMELLIFMVTLAFAMVIKIRDQNARMKGKQVDKNIEFERAQKLPPSPMSSRASTPPPSWRDSRDRAGSQGARGARPRVGSDKPQVFARQPMSMGVRRAPQAPKNEVTRIADEIINGAREQPGPAFASRALSLYSDLLVSLGDRGVRLVEVPWYSRHQPIDLYLALVQCAVRVGNPQYIGQLVDDMVQQGVVRTLSFYESTMKQLAGQKQFHLALRMYDQLVADGFEASAVTLSCLISFAAQVSQFDRAETFFKKLRLVTTPSIRAYMTVLRIHAKRQDWPASMETLKDMQKQGVFLDCIVLSIVFATGVAADRVEDVEQLLEEADNQHPPISDIVCYNTLIKGFAQRGDGEGALRAINRLRKHGLKPNSITFNTAMDAAVRGPKSETAWSLLREMRTSGLKPDKFTCSILVKSLSTDFVGIDRIQDTLALLREVSTKECGNTLRSSMYQMVLVAAAQSEDSDLLAEVGKQMRQDRIAATPNTQRVVARVLAQQKGLA